MPTQKNNPSPKTEKRHFGHMPQAEVPHGRRGKHKDIVNQILDDLEILKDGNAIRISLADLPDTKEKVRSALNRAVHQRGVKIMTSTDEEFLYIWPAPKPARSGVKSA